MKVLTAFYQCYNETVLNEMTLFKDLLYVVYTFILYAHIIPLHIGIYLACHISWLLNDKSIKFNKIFLESSYFLVVVWSFLFSVNFCKLSNQIA